MLRDYLDIMVLNFEQDNRLKYRKTLAGKSLVKNQIEPQVSRPDSRFLSSDSIQKLTVIKDKKRSS